MSPFKSLSAAIALVAVNVVATIVVGTPPALAQEAELPQRLPESGLAIVDCAPPSPAPENSCIVRVPSDQRLGDLASRSLGDEEASFRIVRREADLPAGLSMSATLVLLDLSKGPGNGRVGSWAAERAQIERVIASLPRDGALAIYGFGADLQQITPFSRDRDRALSALRDTELTQNNTILASNITAAMELLEARDDALLKNLIIISDGDEEGIRNLDEITDQAAQSGITLSALGMFWLPEGNPANGRGIDVLRQVTDPQNGLMQRVFLRNGAAAAQQVGSFIDQYSRSIGSSGLILPRGEPAEARITVEMEVPVQGQQGTTASRSYSVRFVPASDEVAPPAEPEIFGYPARYVYIAGAVLGALLLALVVLLFARRARSDEMPEDSDDSALIGADGLDDPFGDDPTVSTEAVAVTPPPAETPSKVPASAYLVRTDTGKRLAVRGDRVAIGRASSNGIVMPDHGVSRVHAELHKNRDGGYSLTDMDSLNGTFINDRKITGTMPVRIGDTLGFGSIRVKLVLP